MKVDAMIDAEAKKEEERGLVQAKSCEMTEKTTLIVLLCACCTIAEQSEPRLSGQQEACDRLRGRQVRVPACARSGNGGDGLPEPVASTAD